ncbi:YusW family protein [Enterococcus sp. 5H]|uniref:YusW family protein n=1 Tax=Enterococcus sp. 5H TaxID=1229490 RepID=UPI00230348C0|nr:YusW family protein [Enterococcus sp. 5H]MDA9472762.1 hypothetical protein [Enterococcus sp. 5H]
MKKVKRLKGLFLVGMIMLIGATSLATIKTVSAATIVSETKNKKVVSYSKQELEKGTDVKFETDSIDKIYQLLKQTKTWGNLGENTENAQRIADRFEQSESQAIKILKNIVASDGLKLKVVFVNKPKYSTVSIGTLEQETTAKKNDSSTKKTIDKTLKAQVKAIDLKIEYKHKDIELEYDVKSNGLVKAKYQNEFTKEKLDGEKAQKIIENLFSGLDLKDSSKSDIKDHILMKLDEEKGVKKFEFKVKFSDKSKIEFEIE